MPQGVALIDELAASPIFGEYVAAFPEASRDAGDMLRVAVQIGVVGLTRKFFDALRHWLRRHVS